MRRRLGREDLHKANPFAERKLEGFFLWRVYEGYDLVDQDVEIPYFEATTDEGELYRPFVETPHLFLEFARLPEQKGHLYESLIGWVCKYGLLGLSRQDPQHHEFIPNVPLVPVAEMAPEIHNPPLRYNDAGGPGDTLDVYGYQASVANKLFTLYEAVLNYDIDSLEKCFARHERLTVEDLREEWDPELEKRFEQHANPQKGLYDVQEILDDMLVYRHGSGPTTWGDYLIDRALLDIWKAVGAALSVFAYPSITSKGIISGPLTPTELTTTYRVRNLLGALYLQFYWLITSADELSRCKQCNRIISYALPVEGNEKRKPRKDKVFCDDRCRQNYHYQNRVKPARNGKKG
jgi:hypothetical protein